MSSALIQALNLGAIEQVAYVVKDMEEALPAYEALFGPFEVSENDLPDCTYRGQTANMSLKMAINNAGPIEIETPSTRRRGIAPDRAFARSRRGPPPRPVSSRRDRQKNIRCRRSRIRNTPLQALLARGSICVSTNPTSTRWTCHRIFGNALSGEQQR